MATERAIPKHHDVIIIGSGISGINTAYHLQKRCPKLSYTLLEGRHELGGTWSLFKYPGIRSDSDLHTFGFSWEPWNQPQAIAEGDAITAYLRDTVKKHHIDEKIQYNHFVDKLTWNTKTLEWSLAVNANGTQDTYTCKYVVMGTGYYDYKEPGASKIAGIENFKGQVVHPQTWPEDLDYNDKNVIIIGSGATAVTLLPNLAKKAKMVTQVQRSPGYFMVLPEKDPLDMAVKANLPEWMSSRLIRFKYLVGGTLLYHFCRWFPDKAKVFLNKGWANLLPSTTKPDPHFVPTYKPWDQRMCITPGGDYFKAYREGKADIRTDQIKTVTEDGLILKSGEKLTADIIVTATGLKIQVGGGAKLFIDDKEVKIADKFMWKGTMVQDIPNLWYVIGYANASWTLAADVAARLTTRMINDIEASGKHSATPYLTPTEQAQCEKDNVPLFPLNSTYVTTAMDSRVIPRAGKVGNWKPRSNYFLDMFGSLYGNVTSGMVYT